MSTAPVLSLMKPSRLLQEIPRLSIINARDKLTFSHEFSPFSIGSGRGHTSGTVDLAHRGLALPYPKDNLDQGVFEATLLQKDFSASLSPSDLINMGKFNDAAKLRDSLLRSGHAIRPEWAYEKIALRMLDEANNPFGKVRVHSFLAWWSLVPSRDQAAMLRPLDEGHHSFLVILRDIIDKLITLPEPDCPMSAVIRFGLLLAKQGYGSLVGERLIEDVLLWTPPAIGRKFFTDFFSAELDFKRRHGSQSSKPIDLVRSRWFDVAIRTFRFAGRPNHAAALQSEKALAQGPLLAHPAESENALPPVSQLRNRNVRDLLFELRFDTQARPPTVVDPLTIARQIRTASRSSQVPSVQSVASLINFYHEHRQSTRGLEILRRRLLMSSQFDSAFSWGLAEMTYYLRYRDHPVKAFQIFDKYFRTPLWLPTQIHNALRALSSIPQTSKVGRASTATSGGVHSRPWPDAMASSLLWETLLQCSADVGLSFEDVYCLFLTQAPGSPWSIEDKDVQDLRRIHSRKFKSATRMNIYAPSRAPVYNPSPQTFGVFMKSCLSRLDLNRKTNPRPSRHMIKRARKILRDMQERRTRPSLSTLLLLAEAHARVGDWKAVLGMLERMVDAGYLNLRPASRHVSSSSHPRLNASKKLFKDGVTDWLARRMIHTALRGHQSARGRRRAHAVTFWFQRHAALNLANIATANKTSIAASKTQRIRTIRASSPMEIKLDGHAIRQHAQ